MRTYSWIVLLVLAVLASCGGGGGNDGGGGNNNVPVLLAPQRYFPSPPGARYTYRAQAPDPPQFFVDTVNDYTYIVEPNPLGAGVHYDLQDFAGGEHGPLFDGLRFSGMAQDTAGTTRLDHGITSGNAPEVLPDGPLRLGQVWFSSFAIQRPAGNPFTLAGSSTLAAVEDVTIGGTRLRDCVRVDVQFSYDHTSRSFPVATGSYWLAPDIGPVLGIMRVAGLEVARATLVSLDLP